LIEPSNRRLAQKRLWQKALECKKKKSGIKKKRKTVIGSSKRALAKNESGWKEMVGTKEICWPINPLLLWGGQTNAVDLAGHSAVGWEFD
jgi:hypothetical protein